jgi:hypothetical protein
MPTTSPRTTDPAALAAKNRSWLFAYIATFVAAATGPDKSVEATRRAGKVLVGSGGEISSRQGEVMLDDIEPVASPWRARRDDAAVAHARQRAFVLASLVSSRKAGDPR